MIQKEIERNLFVLQIISVCIFIIYIDEADSFNREWESHTRRAHTSAIDNGNSARVVSNSRHRPEPRQLALPSTTDPSAR